MNGKQHLRGGLVAGAISAIVVAEAYPNLMKSSAMGVDNRLLMCILLSPVFGYIVPKKFNGIEKAVHNTVKSFAKKDGIGGAVAETVSKSSKAMALLVVALTAVVLFGITYFEIGRLIAYSLLGGAIGSLLPDLDSPRATANKNINRLSISAPLIIGLLYIFKFPPVVSFFGGGNFSNVAQATKDTVNSITYKSVGITGVISVILLLVLLFNIFRLFGKFSRGNKKDKREVNIFAILVIGTVLYMFPVFRDSLINTYNLLRLGNGGELSGSLSHITRQLCVIIFLINCILSKMSEHRKYTHQIIGSGIYFITGWVIFPHIFAIGFILGYMSHWLLDWRTPAGLNPFEISFPSVWKGKFDLKQGMTHMQNSLKAGNKHTTENSTGSFKRR